jgi:hypothetical protein
MRASAISLTSFFLAAALAAPSAADAGDFGRPRPSVFEGLLPPQLWRGPVTGYSTYPFTDLEQELRDRAYALIRPNQPRGKWDLVTLEFRIAAALPPSATSFDVTAYGRMLLWTPGRSEASQYHRFNDDANSDAQLIGPFVAVACRVADMDVKRARSLPHVGIATADETENALGRVRENRMIIAWVRRALFDRLASYRYALERLVIAVPSPLAVEAERTLGRFARHVEDVDPALARCAAGTEVVTK